MSKYDITITIPSSLIIFGEYFISLQNNCALCIAPNIRCALEINTTTSTTSNSNRSHDVLLSSSFAHSTTEWDTPHACPLFESAYRVFDIYKPYFQSYDSNNNTLHDTTYNRIASLIHTITHSASLKINAHINSNNFFTGPTKMGLGSSESCMVLCGVLILILNGIHPLDNIALLAQYAAHAHYVFQNNKGSGYGVYTALYGGLGIYLQHNDYDATELSSQSYWRSFTPPNNVQWYFHTRTSEVFSPSSLKVFTAWKDTHTELYALFQQQYYHHVVQLTHSIYWNSFVEWMKRAKALSDMMGEQLGISTIVDTGIYSGEDSIFWKSTGAGNENAIGISYQNHPEHKKIVQQDIIPFDIAHKGLLCQ